jgi:hypothetical protein
MDKQPSAAASAAAPNGRDAQALDRAARRRRLIKCFWEAVPAITSRTLADRENALDPVEGNRVIERIVGLSPELPADEIEWDLHAAWKRTEQGIDRELSGQLAEALAAILARGLYSKNPTLMRRGSQRRRTPPTTASAGTTSMSGNSARSRSRRASSAA